MKKTVLSVLALVMVVCGCSSVRARPDLDDSSVLVFTGQATSQVNDSEAMLKAQGLAVKDASAECGGFPHRDLVVLDRKLEMFGGESAYIQKTYGALVKVGLYKDQCQQAKEANAEKRKELTNTILEREQVAYDKLIASELRRKGRREPASRHTCDSRAAALQEAAAASAADEGHADDLTRGDAQILYDEGQRVLASDECAN